MLVDALAWIDFEPAMEDTCDRTPCCKQLEHNADTFKRLDHRKKKPLVTHYDDELKAGNHYWVT